MKKYLVKGFLAYHSGERSTAAGRRGHYDVSSARELTAEVNQA